MIIKQLINKEEAWDDEFEIPDILQEQIFIKHIKGPLFFGSTSDFQALAKQIPENATIVLVRMGRMPYMDQSGLYVMMERIDIIPDLIPKDRLFIDLKSSLVWVKENMTN